MHCNVAALEHLGSSEVCLQLLGHQGPLIQLKLDAGKLLSCLGPLLCLLLQLSPVHNPEDCNWDSFRVEGSS